jgi:uncharacterized protein HemX
MFVFIVVFVAVLCLVSGAVAAGVAVWKQEERKLHALEAARLDQMREAREALKEKKKEIERLQEALKTRDATLYSLQSRVNRLEAAARAQNP